MLTNILTEPCASDAGGKIGFRSTGDSECACEFTIALAVAAAFIIEEFRCWVATLIDGIY